MASVMCLYFSMQEGGILECTKDKCHFCTLRATSHTRLTAYDQCTSSTLIVEKAEPVLVHSTLRLRDQTSM